MLRRIRCWVFGHDWNMVGHSLWPGTPVYCINCAARPTDNDARKQWRKDMINGVAFVLVLIVVFITAWGAYAVGYDSGKCDGYLEGYDDRYADEQNPYLN